MLFVATALVCGVAGSVRGTTWRVVPHAASDVVSVTARDGGVTVVDFAITPDTEQIVGCSRFIGGWADLLFDEPMALAEEEERIVFETYLQSRVANARVVLQPLIRDEEGEIFAFANAVAPHLRGPYQEGVDPTVWQRVSTPSFYAGEAGAPQQDVYARVDGTGDFTPTGRLTFLGFRLLLRQSPTSQRGVREGRIALGTFAPAAFKFSAERPFAYLDAFADREPAGAYTVGVQVRNDFQAAPVREYSFPVTYDPKDPVSRSRKFVFDLGTIDNYWIDWQLLNAKGEPVKKGHYRWEQTGTLADAAALSPVDTRMAPPFGCLRINPDHAGRGVYEPGDEPSIELRLFVPGKTVRVNWTLRPFTQDDELAHGSVSVACPKDEPFVSEKIVLPLFAGRNAYRLVVKVLEGERVLDEQEYFYGFRSSPDERHDYPGKVVDRREVKKAPYNRTTFTPKRERMKLEKTYLEDLDVFLSESRQMTTDFTLMIDHRDFQVLPGVFDTHLLDHVLDKVADAGMKLTVRLNHSDLCDRALYRWNKYSRQYDADGRVASGRAHYGAYSVVDESTVGLWLASYRKLFDRYRGHAAFAGYYLMQPGGEWTVVDAPYAGVVSGYDAASCRAFRAWRKAHGRPEIDPPRPDFRGGTRPDLRPEWIDFCRFKSELGGWWQKRSVEAIRGYDDDRLIVTYGCPNTLAETIGDKLDYGHNGGNHAGDAYGAYVDAWNEHRIGWITEPHHPVCWAAYGDPANRGWCLDWSTWVMTAQAAGGGANLHVYFSPWRGSTRLHASGGVQAYDRFETLKPVLTELHEMTLFRQQTETAFLSDPMTLWTKHRTTFSARCADLRRWRELVEQDSVPIETFNPRHDYRLLLPNILDQVMSRETYEACVECVRNGAFLILSANTGSYVPEVCGEEPFALLRALGINPPKGPYQRQGLDVRATAKGCPILADGVSIPFETGERLHAQLQDPDVQKNIQAFRYRWLPETDYFGYYAGVTPNGETVATFADGGAAISRHTFGKGEVLVFWGTPDITDAGLKGMMKRAAESWAGVRNPLEKCPIPHYLEGENKDLGRHYLLVYNEKPGVCTLPVGHIPDGTWFLDDSVSGQRIGLFDGKTLREKGVTVTWTEGYSPLKYLRFVRILKNTQSDFLRKYQVGEGVK